MKTLTFSFLFFLSLSFLSSQVSSQVAKFWGKNEKTTFEKLNSAKTDKSYRLALGNDNLYPDSALFFYWNGSGWDTSTMEIYTYDAAFNYSMIVRKGYFEGSFVNSSKDVYLYDSENNLLEQTNYVWDSAGWSPSFRDRYYYVNGLEQSHYAEYFDSMVWKLSYADSTAYTFNTDKLPTSQISYYYDDIEMAWYPEEKIEFSYGPDKLPNGIQLSEWDETKWTPVIKILNLTWDLGFNLEEAQPTSYVMQLYMIAFWVNYMKYGALTQQGLILRDSTQNYDLLGKKWIDSVYQTFSYNSMGKLLERFQWKWKGDIWDTSEVETHAYDAKGNETLTVYGGKYDQWYEIWWGDRKTYTYGSQDRILEVINESYQSYQGWEFSSKIKYYPGMLISVDEPVNNQIKVYPNPVTQTLYAEGEFCDYRIVDLAGKTLLTGKNYASVVQMDLSNFEKGMYFLMLTTKEGKTETIRVIHQ